MPGFLLDASATAQCAHAGQAKPTAPNPRIRMGGQPVVTQPAPHAVTACPFTTPAGSPMPCVTAQWSTAATRVFAGGMPVLLADSQASCIPNATPVLITVTQLRVRGM
jgi:hypothetical protein